MIGVLRRFNGLHVTGHFFELHWLHRPRPAFRFVAANGPVEQSAKTQCCKKKYIYQRNDKPPCSPICQKKTNILRDVLG